MSDLNISEREIESHDAGEPFRFDVSRYHQLEGIIDERVELIGGRIVKMTPIGGEHARSVTRINRAFSSLWDKVDLWVQNPIRLNDETEPQPDFALIRRGESRSGEIPAADVVALVIEVADFSLAYDRDVKGPLYAVAGIPEYWLVDLQARALWIYSDPSETGYRTRRMHDPSERIAPIEFPECSIRIADLFRSEG